MNEITPDTPLKPLRTIELAALNAVLAIWVALDTRLLAAVKTVEAVWVALESHVEAAERLSGDCWTTVGVSVAVPPKAVPAFVTVFPARELAPVNVAFDPCVTTSASVLTGLKVAGLERVTKSVSVESASMLIVPFVVTEPVIDGGISC